MSIISASTLTNTALQYTADTTGTLVFKTGATPTTALTIDSSGIVSIGGTGPSNWAGSSASIYALQVGSGALQYGGASNLQLRANSYFGGSPANDRYSKTGVPAQNIVMDGGNFYYQYAAGGTADAVVSFTNQLSINSSGNVGIGTITPASKLAIVSGNNEGLYTTNGTQITKLFNGSGISAGALWTISNDALSFGTNNAERMRIDSSGSLLVNTTSTANVSGTTPKLTVAGNVNVTGYTQTYLIQQGILIPDSGGNSSYWAYLGRYSTVQAGYICHIRMYYHIGFNSDNNQNGIIDIFFKSANATSYQNGSTGPFYGDGQYFRLGPSGVNDIRAVQIDTQTYDIYVSMGNYSNASFYTVDTSPGSYWTVVSTGSTTAPSGNYISLTPRVVTYT